MINQTPYNYHPNQDGFVDLTLRLGYPNNDQRDANSDLTEIVQSFDPMPINTQQVVFSYLNGSRTHSDQVMQNEGNGILSGDHNISDNMVANIGNNAGYYGPNYNSNYLGVELMTHTGSNFLGNQNHNISKSTLDQVLPDHHDQNPPYASYPSMANTLQSRNSRVNTSRGVRTSSVRGHSSRRGNKKSDKNPTNKGDGHNNYNYNNGNRRCSNHECGKSFTPMWRKGPLGPKSLCNACGIKYRKQVAKMAAEVQAIAGSDNHDASASTSSALINLNDN